MKMLILLFVCASVSFSTLADKTGLPRLPLDMLLKVDFLFSEADP